MQRPDKLLATLAVSISAWTLRYPLVVLLTFFAMTAAAGWYAKSTLVLQSDTTKLIPGNVTFLRNYNAFKQSLPDQRRLNVIVVEGENPDSVAWAVVALGKELAKRDDLFRRVYTPQFSDFTNQYGLLQLDIPALLQASDKLLATQPALAALAQSPTMNGIARLTELAAPNGSAPAGDAFLRLVDQLGGAAEAFQNNQPVPISWRAELFGDQLALRRGILIVQGLLDDKAAASTAAAGTQATRVIAKQIGITPERGLSLRMTGRGALSQEELQSALSSVQIAGSLSLGLLAVILWWGFRSLRMIAACLTALLCGLVITAGAAAATIGSLNTLSIAFAVLFLGLGIDFAIHVLLRLTESLQETGADARQQASRILAGTGRAVWLAAGTTAIGFLSFLPTDYRGLAELGVISAIGLVVAALVALTFLPAFATLLGTGQAPSKTRSVAGALSFTQWVVRHKRLVLWCVPALALFCALISFRATFDFNTLGLKGSDSESLQTFLDLQADGWVTSYSLSILVPDLPAAEAASTALEGLHEVGEAETPLDQVPLEQEDKLLILEDTAFVLWPSLNPREVTRSLSESARFQALSQLLSTVTEAKSAVPASTADKLDTLRQRLEAIASDPAKLAKFEAELVRHLPETLDSLRLALTAGPLTYETLPPEIRRQNESADGRFRVAVSPSEPLTDHQALRQFVNAVQALYPDATGTPALEVGIADIIVTAFIQALGIALAGIALVLAVLLRSLRDTVLVMTPLLLAGLLTAAASVLFDIPFNFANILVLPLILGLGVDNGVHMIMRWREEHSLRSVMASTTPRAIILSGLTTAASFGTLSFAQNQGLASMGQLLLVGIVGILLSTVLVLPAILAALSKEGEASPLARQRQDGS